jgi:hypothetical protein
MMSASHWVALGGVHLGRTRSETCRARRGQRQAGAAGVGIAELIEIGMSAASGETVRPQCTPPHIRCGGLPDRAHLRQTVGEEAIHSPKLWALDPNLRQDVIPTAGFDSQGDRLRVSPTGPWWYSVLLGRQSTVHDFDRGARVVMAPIQSAGPKPPEAVDSDVVLKFVTTHTVCGMHVGDLVARKIAMLAPLPGPIQILTFTHVKHVRSHISSIYTGLLIPIIGRDCPPPAGSRRSDAVKSEAGRLRPGARSATLDSEIGVIGVEDRQPALPLLLICSRLPRPGPKAP